MSGGMDDVNADSTAELRGTPWEGHLGVGLARAGLTRPAARQSSGHRRAGLALVGDVQDIAGVLDVLDRRR